MKGLVLTKETGLIVEIFSTPTRNKGWNGVHKELVPVMESIL